MTSGLFIGLIIGVGLQIFSVVFQSLQIKYVGDHCSSVTIQTGPRSGDQNDVDLILVPLIASIANGVSLLSSVIYIILNYNKKMKVWSFLVWISIALMVVGVIASFTASRESLYYYTFDKCIDVNTNARPFSISAAFFAFISACILIPMGISNTGEVVDNERNLRSSRF